MPKTKYRDYESFENALIQKIIHSKNNGFGIENFDKDRFGPYSKRRIQDKKEFKMPPGYLRKLKYVIKHLTNYSSNTSEERARAYINEYVLDFERIWRTLSRKDRELFVSLVAYRIMGFEKIKLPQNNKVYQKAIKTAKTLAVKNDTIDPHFLHFILYKFNLEKIGYNIQLYFTAAGVATDFIIEQYAYKKKEEYIVAAELGDVVLDLGACWGDKALYFAEKIGEKGKVYSFEFIPGNIDLFDENIKLNPNLEPRVHLISNPVSNKEDELIYFKDNGPASKISSKPFEGQTGTAKTISIDNFIKNKNLNRVDFIKMDIEGAEANALEGVIETIKKFRPKLAIAIYHSKRDFVLIPNWILDLNLEYEIFLGHYTIHSEETICFAKPRTNSK